MTTYPISPNTVLAKALTSAEDLLRPHLVKAEPERIVFVVGTRINGAPHIGTSLVQSLTFATAARVQERFGVPAVVQFGALDNAPYAVVTDDESGHRYQRAYAHAVGAAGIAEQIDMLYLPLFTALSDRLKVPFSVETYTQQQATQHFRRTWLRVLPRLDVARWYLSPSSGVPHVRVPCPRPGCGWAEKHAERTRVRHDGSGRATVSAVCLHHGEYEVVIEPGDGGYLDLATLYRNLVKELMISGSAGSLYVMVKGSDWMPGCILVDGARQAVGLTRGQLPARLFCPQVVTDTGAKLSKSLIREGRAPLPDGMAPWMLDTREWPGSLAEYADRLLGLTDVLLADPPHFFRSHSAGELGRLMSTATASSVPAR